MGDFHSHLFVKRIGDCSIYQVDAAAHPLTDITYWYIVYNLHQAVINLKPSDAMYMSQLFIIGSFNWSSNSAGWTSENSDTCAVDFDWFGPLFILWRLYSFCRVFNFRSSLFN